MGHNISMGSIRNIRYPIGVQRSSTSSTLVGADYRSHTKRHSYNWPRMIAKVNPPTQREMAALLEVPKGIVYYIVKKILQAKLCKKCKVHWLNMAQIMKRRARSWKLYLKLVPSMEKTLLCHVIGGNILPSLCYG